MVDMRLFQLRPLKNTLESSANNIRYNTSDTLAISLIYIKKGAEPELKAGEHHKWFFPTLYRGMWLLIHAGIKVKPCQSKSGM